MTQIYAKHADEVKSLQFDMAWTHHVVWARVLLNPDCCLSLVVLSCGLQQLALKVLLVAGHLAHSNLNEDAQDVLQQSTVNLLTLSLKLNQLKDCVSGFALHL